jgi:hypothetical protein
MPKLIKNMPAFERNEDLFRKSIMSIFNFMNKQQNKKDSELRGIGFIALGRISLISSVEKQFKEHYIETIFKLIDDEIKEPNGRE